MTIPVEDGSFSCSSFREEQPSLADSGLDSDSKQALPTGACVQYNTYHLPESEHLWNGSQELVPQRVQGRWCFGGVGGRVCQAGGGRVGQ